jgi:hypothetical protein
LVSWWKFSNTGRSSIAGCGTQTAGLGFGGYTFPGGSNSTEEYDGQCLDSRWNLSSFNVWFCRCGLQTAALAFGGPNSTKSYNGTSMDNIGQLEEI